METKKRLISLDEALKATHSEIYWTESQQAAVRSFLVKQPKVDAVEVVHGRWIQDGELDEDGNGQYHCSVCWAGEKHNPIVDVPYCWKCGAKMDGGNEDANTD